MRKNEQDNYYCKIQSILINSAWALLHILKLNTRKLIKQINNENCHQSVYSPFRQSTYNHIAFEGNEMIEIIESAFPLFVWFFTGKFIKQQWKNNPFFPWLLSSVYIVKLRKFIKQ